MGKGQIQINAGLLLTDMFTSLDGSSMWRSASNEPIITLLLILITVR